MTMIYLAIALFALAAVLGLMILIKWLTHKTASRGVIYSHGIFAAAALVLMVAFSLQHPDNFPKISLGLFILSALVGFYMFFQDLKGNMSPMGLAITHGVVAVIGFLSLLFFVFV